MSDSWLWMTAGEIGRGLEAGALDARELTEVYLNAIDTHPEGPGIYVRAMPERARAEAAAAQERARAGLRRGPLDGVPISWKDLFDTAGTGTEAGSALLRGRIPERDAVVLARATRAGMVCLGKTHMTELAYSGLGVNPMTATPPNINDPELAPGGSSSGAATSVAFGLAAAAIGSDTGGSVRVPAAWNDLVGLKTSHGVLPNEGVVPLCPRLDTVGPLCRSVEDAALLTATLAGRRATSPGIQRLTGVRLLVLEGAAFAPERPEPQQAFDTAVERLADEGARIEWGSVAASEASLELAPCLYGGEAYGTWGETIEARPDLMFHQIRARFRAGAAFSAADFVRAWARCDALRAEYLAATAGFDAVLMPTSPILPPNVERLLAETEYYASENLLTLRNTRVANLLGLAALTLPTDVPSCGLTAMAPPGSEARLLGLGATLERALE